MALVDIKVPDIGDFKDVEVIEVLVKPGDRIAAEQSLITVESDKASMEIPASQGGVVKEMRVKLGDKVSEGTVLLTVEAESGGGVVAGAGAPPAAQKPSELAAPATAPAPPPNVPPAGAPPKQAPAGTAAPAPASGGSSAPVVVAVPDIGDFKDVAVIEVLVTAGDTVAAEQGLITVESDKASMEIPSSQAGIVKEVLVGIGDKVSQGSPIVRLDAAGAAGSPAAPAPAPPPSGTPPASEAPAPSPAAGAPGPGPGAHERTLPTAALPAHEPAAPQGVLPHASPSIRKLARELGVPLDEVKGTGPKGRITHDDVQGFVKSVMAGSVQTKAQQAKAPAAGTGAAAGGFPGLLPWPQVDFAKYGPVERKDLSRIKKISAANLHRNWVLIPHVTNHDDADITELEAFRVQTNKENEKAGVKVTMLAFVIKACVAALRKFPEFNASLDGDQLVFKRYFHVGFAADTPNGLVVPVLKDADQKGILQISQEMGALAQKARDGKLTPGDMSGGCFSISSLGGIGGRYFTPIINAPEVAILGVSRSTMEPVWDGKAFQPRLVLPLSLSYDHRVIDGAAAARFNAFLAQVLADFRRVLL